MSKPYKVMIDPGHGGHQPGAVNQALQILEKDINLKVARYIMAMAGGEDFLFDPKVTRISDIYCSLKHRTDYANELMVDAFVSIHCNARYVQQPGIEIETFHFPGSSGGLDLATRIQGGLIEKVGELGTVIDRGVKQKAFYVLRHTQMPAALAELGFLTDDDEALFLNSSYNQNFMAQAIAEAIEQFLEGGGI